MQALHDIYHSPEPEFISQISNTAAMSRLALVGMNCGCEYTRFHLFRNIGRYTRLDHSIGAGLIVWHFTGDVRQSISALLHDVATPAFAHVVDFLHGDHVRQESTEDATLEFIRNDPELVSLLTGYGFAPEDVADYHLFPIADNDTPKLSSDRLEYTLGNALNYGFAEIADVARIYGDLFVGVNESGDPELTFHHPETASEFADLSLKCSKVYVCDADRFAMQRLAEILADGIGRGVMNESDLYVSEEHVIELLLSDPHSSDAWKRYRLFNEMVQGSHGSESRVINAKKRHINPLVSGIGRVTSYDEKYKKDLESFLNHNFDYPVYAIVSQ